MVFPESLFSAPRRALPSGGFPSHEKSERRAAAGKRIVLPLPLVARPRKGLPTAFGTGSDPPFIFNGFSK